MSTVSGMSRRRRINYWLSLVMLVVLVASLACSLPGFSFQEAATPVPTKAPMNTPAPPTPTPQPLPPEVIESDPSPAAELPLDGAVTFYFNQKMDTASVEAALQIDPATGGELVWPDDATLTYNPDNPLEPESEIEIIIDEKARSANGLALLKPVSFKYQTTGYLRLTQSLPEPGATEVEPTSAIVAAFNRPVVPLGGDQAEMKPAFSIEPAAGGQGEWVNTSTYIFYPDPPLEGGTTYSVVLSPTLQALDGGPLEKVERWSFTTSKPRLVTIEPLPDSGTIRVDSQFVLSFNQPMDPSSVQSSFSLARQGLGSVAGENIWNEDFTVMTFTPADLLERNQQYMVVLTGQATARGGTPIGDEYVYSYSTVPELAIIGNDPPQGGVKSPYGSISLYFSAPILDDELKQYFAVDPPISNMDAWWDENERVVFLHGNFEPQTGYTLDISTDLHDPWDGKLTGGYRLNFTTAPLEPQLWITNGSDVQYLTTQDDSVPVEVVNISNVSLARGTVPLTDFMAMISGANAYDIRRSYYSPDQIEWQQALDIVPNRSQTEELFISPDRSTLSPGLYYLRFNIPNRQVQPGPFLLGVSNAHLTFKLSATEALVWALDAQESKPLANTNVTIYDDKGQVRASGLTDEEGVFRSAITTVEDPYSTHYAALGQPGQPYFGIALSNWNQGAAPWDFGIATDFTGPTQKAYLYTDRPIYRPGQTVFFRAIVREAYNGRYHLPDDLELPLTLYSDMGEEIANIELPLSTFGSGHGEYTLPVDTQPGHYRLESRESNYWISVPFQVAEYRKPEINLQVSFDAEQSMAGNNLVASVNARYFFDAPAGNVPVKWTLLEAPDSFYLPGYRVGVQDTRWLQAFYYPGFGDPLGIPIDQGEAVLDSLGMLTMDFPTDASDERKSYTLEVTVQDESGLPVSGRDSIKVNPTDFYVGVSPDTWVGRAGESLGFDVQVVDWEHQPAGVRDLTADFNQVVWERRERQDSQDPFAGPVFVPQYTLVGSTDFSTNQDGQARLVFTPPEPGTYQLNVSGSGTRTEVLLWVGGPGQAIWPNLPNQRLQLTTDSQNYLPGETAQIFIPNPFDEPVSGLLTVERGEILRYEVVKVPAGGEIYDLPLSSEDAPNVYVTVLLIGNQPDGRLDFRNGLLNVPVAPIEQTLNVDLRNLPERMGPGDKVTLDIQVTDSTGDPVQGEFSLSVVDTAVLALADPNVADIESAFYGEQPLGVRTGFGLAAYAHRSVTSPPGLGGGGGDVGLVPPVVRERFPDTAYWNAEVLTDANGEAQVDVLLPDSLTTWQITARGTTQDTRVGQAVSEVITTKELLVRPVTPRFLVIDDYVLIAAVVQNNTPGDLLVEVGLQSSGIELDEVSLVNQQVNVPALGRARVEWWGTVQDVESVDLVFTAQAGDLQDATRPSLGRLPVLRYTAPQTFGTTGILDEAGEVLELVSLPRSFEPRGGNLQLELATSLAGSLYSALDVLEHYPYECTEQTLSRFLPNLEAYRAVQQFNLDTPDLQARLDRTLQTGLEQLLSRQNVDGGWSWWPGGESDPYITAYVLFGLSRAAEAGVPINASYTQRAVDYLYSSLITPQMTTEVWQLDRQVFVQFALAYAGQANMSGLNGSFRVRDQLNPWSQALLALAFEKLSPGSESARTLLSDLQATSKRSATGAHWEINGSGLPNMVSPLTNTSMVVYALAQFDPGSPLLADAVRYLISHRQADRAWGSTYSTAWTLLALTEALKGTGELGSDYSFEVTLNGLPLVSGEAADRDGVVAAEKSISDLYPNDPNALELIRSPGLGRLYYSAFLNISRPADSVPVLEQGISINRETYLQEASCLEGGCPAIHEASVGDQLQVRLTLTLPEEAYHLMVEDYLPAGTEIVDTSLKTSQQSLDVMGEPKIEPLYDPGLPFSSGWGWWLFNTPRIYDDHIAWAVDYLPAGTYELTYTLAVSQPGEYHVLPARAWQFYFPEVQGNSAGSLFTIRP